MICKPEKRPPFVRWGEKVVPGLQRGFIIFTCERLGKFQGGKKIKLLFKKQKTTKPSGMLTQKSHMYRSQCG